MLLAPVTQPQLPTSLVDDVLTGGATLVPLRLVGPQNASVPRIVGA